MTALRLAREFNLRLILDGAIEGYLVRDEIKRAEVPVLVGPTMQRLGSLPPVELWHCPNCKSTISAQALHKTTKPVAAA